MKDKIQVSVVMPCLDEEQTIGVCIEKALRTLERMGVPGEVIVCDNGSTDRSVEIAESSGARVVHQPVKGYGSAYLKALSAACGQYIVMGDSDNQLDFDEIDRLIAPLYDGYDMAVGNRFQGRITPGAMSWHHRYIGNPILSGILNLFFRTGIHDAHCGMRAFTREAYERMGLQTTGMEFASEMVIKASKAGLRITEVPVTLHPRTGGTKAKLRSFRDGWRHLRFMLLYSPTHLFLWPGGVLMLLGALVLGVLATGPLNVRNLFFGFHWMFVGSLLVVLGFQIINLGLVARFYSLSSHFDEGKDPIAEWVLRHFSLEAGIMVGCGLFVLGILLDLLIIFVTWRSGEFQSPVAVRLAILALTSSIIGGQTVFSSFFLSLMTVKRRGWD